nr:reverse transcriptase domain-containing protein [Tanacetum cinerariifolium]
MVRALLLDKKNQSSALASSSTPAPVKAVEPNCVTCGGSGTLPGNTITNPKEDLRGITTRSDVTYQGPTIPTPSKVVKQGTEVTKDQVQTPCSQRMDECLALADLGASINLMPLFVWEGLSLPELTPTCMTLELADRSVSKPIDIAKDVLVKVGTGQALIDVHKDTTASGNPTPYDDPIVSTTSPTLTPFGDSDFLLFEEADAFLAILNSEPLPPLPNHKQYMPSYKKELKACEAKTVKSSIDEPPHVELKDLPPHLEYAFLEGDNKLPVIIVKELGDEDKSALIKVLKSHKRSIAWKLSNIHGINLEFCTHKILMEEDYKPAVQHQRRVNPKIYDVIKKEVEKLLDAGLIYPISDSPWVSPVHCVHKKGGFTVVENEENEFIPTRLVTGWRMLERLAGNEYCCFLNGFSGYFQILIDPHDQEKTTFTYPYGTFVYRRMPFSLCNAPGVVLGQRNEKHFKPIHYVSKTMNDAESDYTMIEKEMLAVVAPWFEDFANYYAGKFIVKDYPDCEVSRALSFCLSFTRASHPQLHFGNPSIQILSTNVLSLGIPNKRP